MPLVRQLVAGLRGLFQKHSAGQDLRFAARMLRKNPGFTAVAVLTLALGIGANVTMFSAVEALLFKLPAEIRAPQQLVRIGMTGGDDDIASYPGYQKLSENSPALELAAEASSSQLDYGRGSDAREIYAAYVSHTYFHLLGVKLLAGRSFTVEEDSPPAGAPVVVLAYRFWQQEFGGDQNVLGRGIWIGGRDWTVIGITPKGFTGADFSNEDVWLPLCDFPPMEPGENILSNRASRWLVVLGRPRNGLTIEVAQAEATSVYRHSGGASEASIQLQPLFASRTRGSSGETRVSLWLAGVAFIVLLIACANVASLLLARMVQRRHELAVRQQLGATRGRLIRQILVENFLLGALGGAAGLLLAFWAHPLVRTFLLPQGFYESRFLDWPLIELTAAFTALAALASGLPPALRISRPGLIHDLKSGDQGHTREGSALRCGLLVVQVALTLMLCVGAGLLIRSLRDVRAIDLGFQPDRVLLATMDLSSASYSSADIDAIYKALLARAVTVPGVDHAAVATSAPFRDANFYIIRTPATGSSPAHVSGAECDAVTPDYFAAMGMKILHGRPFLPTDTTGAPTVVIVNESLARKFWPEGEALDKCLMFGQSKVCSRVIGVVPDSRRTSPFTSPSQTKGESYVPTAQSEQQGVNFSATALLIHTAKESPALGRAVFAALESVAPDSRFVDVQPLSTMLDEDTRPWRLGATMFTLFGALALTLATVGIFGVLAFLVRQRTAEIGVRMTLGALPRDILKLVVWHGMKFVGLGIVAGIAAALALTRLLKSLLYGVSASDPITFIGVSILLVLVALAACYIPARRAMKVDPMVALRYE